ncbi:MAG: hypothetical protein K0S99_2171, partial [Thermomicrobiales bacterium]|nr:hypothetical protein [Thermomicrobiales bacterium]
SPLCVAIASTARRGVVSISNSAKQHLRRRRAGYVLVSPDEGSHAWFVRRPGWRAGPAHQPGSRDTRRSWQPVVMTRCRNPPYNPDSSTQEWKSEGDEGGFPALSDRAYDDEQRCARSGLQPSRRAQERTRRDGDSAGAAGSRGAQDATPAAGLTEEQRGWWERGSRNDVNGWIHLRIAGAPFERGFQHGSCRTPRRPRSPRDRPT